MKKSIFKFMFMAGLALLLLFPRNSEAQIFAKKMPVGVVNYSYFDSVTKFHVLFKDLKGTFDQYDFNDLPTELIDETYFVVFDYRVNFWRLPVNYFEAMGIAEREGDEPLPRLEIRFNKTKKAYRAKID